MISIYHDTSLRIINALNNVYPCNSGSTPSIVDTVMVNVEWSDERQLFLMLENACLFRDLKLNNITNYVYVYIHVHTQ